MPTTTEHYLLEAFLDGDAYSALADRRRFSTIDNQFNIMTEITGDGVIEGWTIVPLTFPNVRVTQGTGFIDQYYIATFDDQDFELSANSTFNFYAQRRVGISGTIGPRSDVASVTYSDAAAPATPSGFSAVVGVADSSFSVDLTWTANTEIDLDHYELSRSTNASTGFTLIATIVSSATSYTDETVDEDTLYHFRLSAVDQSDFASTPATDSVTTTLSSNIPPNPISVTMPHSEDAINILWKRPTSIIFSKIKEWRITYVTLDGSGAEILETQVQKTINKALYDFRIDGLINGETYNVTIQTIDTKDRASVGFSSHVIPQPSSAPQDPILLDLVQSQQVQNQIILNLEWTDGADEYDPLIPHAYQIYITVDGQQESLPIFTFETDYQIELYTFDNFNQMSIPEDTLITIRLTSLTENGLESFGMYTRFVTDRHGQPLPVSNLSSDFNQDTSQITVTWNNQVDTANVRINIFDEALDGTYTGTIVDDDIGRIEFFVFDAELDHKYTITITPFDADGVAGPSDITVEITLVAGGVDKPLPPVSIFPQIGDRQVSLSWDASPSITTTSYRIYRKSGRITIVDTDWTILDTLPRTRTEFTNYGLENDSFFSYYITSIDIFGQESEHLPDGAINLNFIEIIPRPSGILTDPDNVVAVLSGDDIIITWEALLEEFDAFVIARSLSNLHSWQDIATVDRNTTSFTDSDVPLVDGNTFHYTVTKVINDSDIVVQLSSVSPDNSICLGELTLGAASFNTPVTSCRRDILNLVDPLSELTSQFLLTHLHREIALFDPDRIDLEPELIVTDWSTVDGRIFTTGELDISGTGHTVKVDGRFPQTFFTVDATTRRLIFTEPIVAVDDDGNVTGDLPEIEMKVQGVEEVQGILPNSRFDDIHARQMAFGRMNLEQLPPINHEGRIRERMLPKTFLLQRFSNHTFIVPEGDTDVTKTFGDGTTFYAVIESDGLVAEVIDFDQENDGDVVAFRSPSFSPTTLQHLASESFSTTASGTFDSAYDRDVTTWFENPATAFFGENASNSFDAYLRMQINVPKGSSIQSASIVIQSSPGGSGTVDADISVLDPDDVPSSVELTVGNGTGIRAAANLNGLTINWEGVTSPAACAAESTPDITSLIQAFIDTDQYSPGVKAVFRIKEKVSATNLVGAGTSENSVCSASTLLIDSVRGLAEVTSETAFQSEKSYHFQFGFTDTNATRWVRISTFNAPIKPNPIIDLKKRLRFKMLSEDADLYLCLGVRETNLADVTTGDNGGTAGAIEWVGAESFLTNSNGEPTPIGKLVEAKKGEWQEIEFDLEKDNIINFEDGDNILDGDFGVLEHLAFTIVPDATGAVGPFDVYIDKIEQVDDVLAAGSSQGILVSRDFGSSWELARLVETPVHTFYRAIRNKFIWAISANEALLSVDPAHWFSTNGLTGTQYIRDIVEDEFGNMYVSTEKGVFWFEIALISTFASWRQTQPVNAFTTDCYALYHDPVASGIDDIWVSTEIGIFKTSNNGATWEDTGLDTQGLPAFQFINIGNSSNPNIIAITRKHVLRKMKNETNFSIIANFEVQHNIFDIWKMEFFAGRLYVSTGKGIYSNALDELFDSSLSSTVFERVFPGLEFNGTVGVAFGLDEVVVDSPLGSTTQLFIGQENRLIVADENNVLSIKEQFPNKELPSFFADDDELTIGYIYNAFNNVLIFRVPQPINKFYKAAFLPRKKYLPINGSWSQTNPEADVFIHFNGIPKWLDFKLDQDSILSEVQAIQGTLLPLRGTLDTFNSLSPQSGQFLTAVLEDITTLISGGEGEGIVPLVNNSTIIQFLDDYTRFISLLTSSFVISSNIDVAPQIHLLGFARSERGTGSRAEELESQEEFTANESTGIIIDTFAGEIDFLTIFTQTTNLEDRLEFFFNKYDKLDISIFNANVDNIGEFTHRELEDQMEAVNTGLSSHLARAHYTNLIKAGIFFEKNHNDLFNTFDVSNIQSKYYASHTNNWYDIVNSTVDYNLIDSTGNHPESRFGNTAYFFTENLYIPNRVWIGTDNDILQYSIDTSTGDLTLEEIVQPGNGIDALFIWDIFVLGDDENDIYVVAEEQDSGTGHIFRTTDSGSSWEDLETINVPARIYQFAIISGNKVAATEEGIFYSDNTFGTWFPANVTPSPQLSSSSPALTAFRGRILNLDQTTFFIAEADRWFFTSGGGVDWFALSGRMSSNNTQIISKIMRFKSLTWIATDKGLYNDGNSLLSDSAQFGLQILEDTAGNSTVPISDIVHGTKAIYCSGISAIYRFVDNVWQKYEVPNTVGIHKLLFCGVVAKDFLVVISHNTVQTLDVTSGEGVFG